MTSSTITCCSICRSSPPRSTINSHGGRSSAPVLRCRIPQIEHAIIRWVAFGPRATPAQIAHYDRMLRACPPDVRAACGIAMADMELHQALPRLTVPTLVVAGEHDWMTPPAHAKRIATLLPNWSSWSCSPMPGTSDCWSPDEGERRRRGPSRRYDDRRRVGQLGGPRWTTGIDTCALVMCSNPDDCCA